MSVAELLRKLQQLNLIATSNIEETGDHNQSRVPTELDTIENEVQTALDLEAPGLLLEWSTAYSQYILRVE